MESDLFGFELLDFAGAEPDVIDPILPPLEARCKYYVVTGLGPPGHTLPTELKLGIVVGFWSEVELLLPGYRRFGRSVSLRGFEDPIAAIAHYRAHVKGTLGKGAIPVYEWSVVQALIQPKSANDA